jgi:hypothetical protein
MNRFINHAAPEEGQFETESPVIASFRFEVASEIPPLGPVIGMLPVVSGKGHAAGPQHLFELMIYFSGGREPRPCIFVGGSKLAPFTGDRDKSYTGEKY